MFLIRRVAILENGSASTAWKAAKLLTNICKAYQTNNGRSEATVYISGTGTPASEVSVCAEWMQETIEANRLPNVPQSVRDDNAELSKLVKNYSIEFHEVATEEKIAERS
jgi:hypothetical protein